MYDYATHTLVSVVDVSIPYCSNNQTQFPVRIFSDQLLGQINKFIAHLKIILLFFNLLTNMNQNVKDLTVFC